MGEREGEITPQLLFMESLERTVSTIPEWPIRPTHAQTLVSDLTELPSNLTSYLYEFIRDKGIIELVRDTTRDRRLFDQDAFKIFAYLGFVVDYRFQTTRISPYGSKIRGQFSAAVVIAKKEIPEERLRDKVHIPEKYAKTVVERLIRDHMEEDKPDEEAQYQDSLRHVIQYSEDPFLWGADHLSTAYSDFLESGKMVPQPLLEAMFDAAGLNLNYSNNPDAVGKVIKFCIRQFDRNPEMGNIQELISMLKERRMN